MFRKGEWVWAPSKIGVPIGARVKVTDTGQRVLIDDEGEEHRLSAEEEASFRVMHPTSVEGVDDMIRLGDLHEAGLLRNLLVRHRQGIIYTYTGSVLVAVNPYQELPIYTGDQVRLYHGRRLGELPPHVFAIADSCYFNMRRKHKDQCCIISGESGAGKTESTKLILQFLAAVSGQHSWIEQQILEANPILEAFGNAKTIRNDNSSRFGKYLEIFFNKDGVIEGAKVEQYLLEKSRVCHQASEERNYHIFYCMLAGMTAEQKKTLSLGNATEFNFLKKGDCLKCDGRDDAKDYARIRTAMKILTFTETHCLDILRLLASLLHLGNVSFTGTILNNMASSDVSTSDHFSMASKLLEAEETALGVSLTHRSFLTNRERVSKPLSTEQAEDCRDAFVKAIYNKLFIWIVGKINVTINKTPTNGPINTRHSIGLLDIFGFENFNSNSFEQLCINFANEQLQQFFVGHVFKQEQSEYLKEAIVWKSISFTDNQQTLDLLACKPLNLLALVDEESHFPKGTDVTMLNKMNKVHSKSHIYIPSRSEHDRNFGIRHFAGVVQYDSRGFLEKNRDAISSDIIKLIGSSTNKLLRQIFERELAANAVKAPGNGKVFMTPKSSLRTQSDGRRPVTTLTTQFRQSLDSLMKALSLCQPFFVRCFKPNDGKQSNSFDRELCMRQLRYSGMIDTIRIRKLGYPIRHTFKEFLLRYRVLLKTTVCDPKTETPSACCNAICKAVVKTEDGWKIGTRKIFLKEAHDSLLERERERELNRKALIIQRVMLGHRDRKSFVAKRKAVLVLQKQWRAYRERTYKRKVEHGYERLASKVRGRQAQLQYQRQRAAAVTMQSQVRGFLTRQSLKRKSKAVVLLQAHTRGMQARRTASKMRTDAFLSAQERETRELIALELQRKLEEHLSQSQQAAKETEPINDQELVENMFGFLPMAVAVGGQQGEAPEGFEDIEEEQSKPEQLLVIESIEETPGPETSPAPATVRVPVRVLNNKPVEEENEENEKEEEGRQYDDSDEELSFSRFCAEHFQGNATSTHITSRLRQPLLPHEDEGDILACLTVWWIILRFMGDLPEPKHHLNPERISLAGSVVSNMGQRQGRRLSNLVGLDQKLLRKNRKKQGNIGSRRASTLLEEPEDFSENEDILIGEGPTLDRPMSSLEKLHIIVGYAISRRDIRDEIYCQICKQLVNNRNKESFLKGWVLLSICLGIFPPTNVFMKHLESFLCRGPSGYGPYCSERFRRIVANGERGEPPCWIELQATRIKKPMMVLVGLMDGRSISLPVDSACTAFEVCQAMAKKISLSDTYGFSLYIGLHDKVWSLGSGKKHVMDAISQCEQEVRRKGAEEQHAPWRLYIKKELFAPWHESMGDPVGTDLVYRQVIRCLKSGEYTSEKEDDFVQLAAMHYYVEFGTSSSVENAQKVVAEVITTSLIETRSQARWVQLINTAHSQAGYTVRKRSKESVRAEAVDYARKKWPIFFSKFYEVTMESGPPLPKSSFIVAINCTGIFFQDNTNRKLLELSYPEVTGVSMDSSEGHVRGHVVSLSTFGGVYVLSAEEAEDMSALINMFLEGLRERSVYAVAMQDVNKSDDPTLLSYKRGDMLVLVKDGGYAPDSGWIQGSNERTQSTGVISTDTIMVLPTMTKPNDTTLSLLNLGLEHKKSTTQNVVAREEAVAPVSLKEFSFEYFRQPGKDVGRHGLSRGAGREKLWACSKEPLKQPLLRSLVGNSELSPLACSAFTAILKYMGDYPVKQMHSPIELTEQIFGEAMQHEALQDEIYCQIMRQMTNNSSRISVDYGWQLMWLCTGLFPPSQTLLRHTHRFLESRPREPLAADCLQRLQAMLRMEPRKLPPHQVEVEAIQQNSSQIFHKVHYPNDTAELFEVTSTTKIKDLCRDIARKLILSSADGFSLFMKTPNRIVSLNENQYFFDSLKDTKTSQPKKTKKGKEGTSSVVPYLVIFMRKLWFNVIPGRDETADLMFHFPQEKPKYLRGYHQCTKEQMISLAGLLFRVKVDSDRSQFVMIPKILKELVPADQLKLMSPEDWKKNTISAYNKQAGITVEEAKVAFLRAISSWPTFGCAFFDVKQQTSDHGFPDIIRIAISKQGVNFINPKTKELLAMHPFSRITNWSSGATFFHMNIGNMVKGSAFLCETSLGYKMDDILTSYVNMYENERQAAMRPRNSVFVL